MEVLIIYKNKSVNILSNLFDVLILFINSFHYWNNYRIHSRYVSYFDVKYKYSLENRLIKYIIYQKLNNIIGSKIGFNSKIFNKVYEEKKCFKTVIYNNQKYLKFSDIAFFNIKNSNRFNEIISLPLNELHKDNASVEWMLKELGCSYNIEEVLQLEEIEINNKIDSVETEGLNNELPKKFNKECSLYKSNESTYLKYCNEFPRNLKKPTYSAVLLYEQVLAKISRNKEGLHILNLPYDNIKEHLGKFYPNSINNQMEKSRVQLNEKRIKRIISSKKVELDKYEIELINGAIVIAKIKNNQVVLKFLEERNTNI